MRKAELNELIVSHRWEVHTRKRPRAANSKSERFERPRLRLVRCCPVPGGVSASVSVLDTTGSDTCGSDRSGSDTSGSEETRSESGSARTGSATSGSGEIRSESGSATITAVGLILLAIVLAATLATVSSVFNARVQAQTGADLAALAGAQVMASSVAFEDATAGCARATTVAEHNSVQVTGCQVSGGDVTISVSVPVGPWTAVAQARAGPLWD